MKRINKPDLDILAIIDDCSGSYRELNKKNNFQIARQFIKDESEKLDVHFTNATQHQIPASSYIVAGITKEDMKQLYETKFVRSPKARKNYYDKIMSLAADGICPLCGIGVVSTLDHYMAKSKYPVFAVTPINLIPACKDCNHNKLDLQYATSSEASFHPYYDDFAGEIWLEAILNIENNNLEVNYITKRSLNWTSTKNDRVENNFKIFKLNKLYMIRAADEIVNQKEYWRLIIRIGGEKGMKDHFENICQSYEVVDWNSWRSALYRALLNDVSKISNIL